MTAVLRDLELNTELMESRVRSSKLYSTDLAEAIMLRMKVDYRTAHKIVGLCVREIHESPETLILDSLNASIKSVTDRSDCFFSEGELTEIIAVSYTHLTLPTICSV